jgi:hypothetical protein
MASAMSARNTFDRAMQQLQTEETDSSPDSVLGRTEARMQEGLKTAAAVIVTVAVLVPVINQILTTDVIGNSTGPFSPLVDQVGNIGVAAFSLMLVGLLALAGAFVLGYVDMY